MIRRIHIDPLLLFFVLAIALLVLSSGKLLLISGSGNNQTLVQYLDPDPLIHIPDQGGMTGNDSLIAYNSDYDIFYSLDGGEVFTNGGHSVDLKELQNRNLLYLPSSYHWKRPQGVFPECKNIVIRLKHKNRLIQTEDVYLNFVEEYTSELPVLSITAKLDDLIGESNGILIFGQEAWSDSGFYKSWWNRNANFQQRGYEWERAVYIHYFQQKELVYEDKFGIRISGNATRGFPQKSMQLIARKNYGSEFLEHRFFGKQGQKKYRSLVIRNSGNDNTKTLFADLFMQRLASETHVTTQAGQPVVVYINGNYWGIYNLRERIDPYYLAKTEDAKEDEITILEGGDAALKDGDKDEKKRFDELVEKMRDSAADTAHLMVEVLDEIDAESFTDYVIFETFYANNDWPANNALLYKTKGGKWKWMLHDLDYGLAYLGSDAVNMNLFDKLDKTSSIVGVLYRFLMKDAHYKNQFKTRAAELLDSVFSEEHLIREFESVKELYQKEIGLHIRRWRMIDSLEDWEKNCKANLQFLMDRPEVYKSQLEKI